MNGQAYWLESIREICITEIKPMSPPIQKKLNPPPETAASRWRFWIPLSVGILIPLLFLIWRVNVSIQTSSKLKALEKAGYPTSMAALQQKYYAPITDDNNVALYYVETFPHFGQSNLSALNPLWRGRVSMDSSLSSSKDRQTFSNLLYTNREVLNRLRQAPEGQISRYPLDFSRGFMMLMPHLAGIKMSEQVLMLDALMSAEAKGSTQTMDDFKAAFRLSDSLNEEPILISQLVRFSSHTLIFSSLEHVLTKQPFTDEQLKQLASIVARQDVPQTMDRALAGEMCCGIFAYQMPVASLNDLSQGNDEDGRKADNSVGIRLMRASGFTGRDLNFYLDIMTQYLATARLGYPGSLEGSDKIQHKVSVSLRRLYIMSGLLLPALGKAMDKGAGDVARLDIMETALAIERYRLANQNHLPEKLDDLVPAFLPSVPNDPFDGRPLRYQKLPKGYRVYSIGANRKDDGGKEPNPKDYSAPSDITFTVER